MIYHIKPSHQFYLFVGIFIVLPPKTWRAGPGILDALVRYSGGTWPG